MSRIQSEVSLPWFAVDPKMHRPSVWGRGGDTVPMGQSGRHLAAGLPQWGR